MRHTGGGSSGEPHLGARRRDGRGVGVVVGAFKFMQASMNSTEAGANKLAKVTGAITGIFNGLFKVLKPLGEFIFNGFVKYVEFAGAALDKLGKAASATLRFLGFDKAADSVDNFSNSNVVKLGPQGFSS